MLVESLLNSCISRKTNGTLSHIVFFTVFNSLKMILLIFMVIFSYVCNYLGGDV